MDRGTVKVVAATRGERRDLTPAAINWDWVIRSIQIAYLPIIALILTVHLTSWPQTWFDEGLNVSTAATLAEEGVYGLPDADGIREMDPAIQTGPVVLLPVAMSFKLFGTGLLQARMVMVVFSVLALCAYYVLARHLGDRSTAMLGIGILLLGNLDWQASFVTLGRQVLGEVPALGLFCLGCWLWLRALDHSKQTLRLSVTVGVVFGLAMVTKSQMAVNLSVALGVIWIADLLYFHVMRRWFVIAIAATSIACVLIWYGIQIQMVGLERYQENSAVLREGFSIHIASLSLSGPRTAIGSLWRSGALFLAGPGIIYGLHLARQRGRAGLMHAIPMALICVWLGWHVVLSIGWGRYSAIPLMLSTIYSARLLRDLWTCDIVVPWHRMTSRKLWLTLAPMLAIALVLWAGVARQHMGTSAGTGLVLILVAAALARIRWQRGLLLALVFAVIVMLSPTNMNGLSRTGSTSAQHSRDMAAYLHDHVPHDALIESWSWELSILVPQRFHHPQTHVTNMYTLEVYSNLPVPEDTYDPGASRPQYILENWFSDWLGIYSEYVALHGEEVVSFGDYTLYRVR